METLFNIKKLLRGLAVLLILCSCKKEQDTMPPQIIIHTPTENSSFNIPAHINITASIKDETKIESIHAEILNENQQIVAAVAVKNKG